MGYVIIWTSFICALTLQIVPWPGALNSLRPSWAFLVVCYWVLALPHRVNVGTALVVGLVLDVLLGPTMGVRGMIMSVVVYPVAAKFLMLRNMSLWKQALLIGFLSVTLDVLVFSVECLVQEVSLNPLSLWSGVTSCILWPWLFLFLRRIRRYWNIH